MIELRTHSKLADIREQDWDLLLDEEKTPYLRWRFLNALETTGCVRPEVGWVPFHITLHEDGEMVAAAPAYIKGNSEGEFVFDHSWAEFAYGRLGLDYYPKLLVACPFTPATGPRLLMKPGVDERGLLTAFVHGVARVVDDLGISSGHVLFPRRDQAETLERAGLALRFGVQYHWENRGYDSFDAFLNCYNSKRRNQIKRERRELEVQGIELEVRSGSDIDASTVDHMYAFYRATVAKHFWGRQYLNRGFFELVSSEMADEVLIVLARERASRRVLGGAFNLLGQTRMFGRYWGASDDVRFLHFNVCYYKGIEECIARGLSVFEPGAGGEHKVVRGFEPTLTYSAHYLANPKLDGPIRDFLRRERSAVSHQLLEETTVLRPLATPGGEE